MMVVMNMARTARAKSESNIYHVMLRGINRQQIFLDDEDSRHFLEVLRQCRMISNFHLYAYCLMGNHVHLLIHTGEEPLDLVMKRIGTRYVVWYNSKHERVGHLFQDRYKSEPVDNDAYFFTVLRYILNNPVKAGLCDRLTEYPLSSAQDYFKGAGLTDTSFAEEIMGRSSLLNFLSSSCEDSCMDETSARLSDRRARELILGIVGLSDEAHCIQAVNEQPEQYVSSLRSAGLSIRQICRLTGLPFGIIRKY
ncbi:MAG: transposase [Oscillospiraceae bacterium]|nr:transposase [Oscillospiraceae bacterium]